MEILISFLVHMVPGTAEASM